jgi:hypothetical protein
VRCELALIRCGDRIFEVTTATLGPLPLDQLPKSKPVTPYAVLTIVPTGEDNANPALGDRSSLNTRSPIVIPSPPGSSRVEQHDKASQTARSTRQAPHLIVRDHGRVLDPGRSPRDHAGQLP